MALPPDNNRPIDSSVVLGRNTKTEKDVIFLELSDVNYPFGLNLLTCSEPNNPVAVQEVVDRYLHVFKMLWHIGKDTPRLENTLRASLLTLAINNLTIAEMSCLLKDTAFRKRCIDAIPVAFATEGLRGFWKYDFNELYVQDQLKYPDSSLNKVLHLLMVQEVAFVVGQSKTTIDFQKVMDEKKIVLVKLDAWRSPGTSVTFIGSLLLALLLNAAYSRSAIDRKKEKQFNLYIDTLLHFATEYLATLITEARKLNMATILAHEFRDQLDTQLKGVTLTVANLVAFQVSSQDAKNLAELFAITSSVDEKNYDDMVNQIARELVS
ncbi:MAG TPA: hypothetical protein VEP90_12250, partial [Methylomirabilota bacterium]|nr:hypothetical protein [Methylomirabilota bacterium]